MAEEKIIFKRKLYTKLLEWKNSADGKTAALIEGARRVGKSTIAEEFAKKEYKSYILIDFSKASKEIRNLFEDISDLNFLFLQLQILYKTDLHERESAIIFDEVQKAPLARQAIKHLVADRRYDYIETGSLISIHKNVKDIVIPSEEEKFYLHPMDYEEFKWALGDMSTIPLLRQVFTSGKSFGDAVNRKLMRDFRLYMIVGGMPQAVETYIKTNNLSSVDKVKRGIIDIYESDFEKTDNSGRAKMLYDAIPGELAKNTSRYQLTSVIGNNSSDESRNELLRTLSESMTVNFSYHSNDPSVGFSLNSERL